MWTRTWTRLSIGRDSRCLAKEKRIEASIREIEESETEIVNRGGDRKE